MFVCPQVGPVSLCECASAGENRRFGGNGIAPTRVTCGIVWRSRKVHSSDSDIGWAVLFVWHRGLDARSRRLTESKLPRREGRYNGSTGNDYSLVNHSDNAFRTALLPHSLRENTSLRV